MRDISICFTFVFRTTGAFGYSSKLDFDSTKNFIVLLHTFDDKCLIYTLNRRTCVNYHLSVGNHIFQKTKHIQLIYLMK